MFRKYHFAFALTVLALLALALAIPSYMPVIGIILRLLIAGYCFLNCIVLLVRGKPVATGVVLALVGLGLFITALMGYGFNGHPPLAGMQ